MSKGGRAGRLVRSDKKVDVKATMSVQSKKNLHDFALLCNEPIKDVAERLIVLSVISRDVIEKLCIWFRRDYRYDVSIVFGDESRARLSVKNNGETGIVSIKFKRQNYDALCAVAYALDITPSAAASVLIVLSMQNHSFMSEYVNVHLTHLDQPRIVTIKKFLNL